METVISSIYQFFKESFDESIVLGIFLLLLFAVVLLLIGVGIYAILDSNFSHKETLTGNIIDKKYVGESDSTGTTVVSTSNGGVGIGTTHSHEDERFLLFINSNGTIHKVETDMQFFYNCKLKDPIIFYIKIGGFSKSILKTFL